RRRGRCDLRPPRHRGSADREAAGRRGQEAARPDLSGPGDCMTATDRITLVVLNPDGSREKFTLSSWVGIPRKHELLWIGDDPFMVIEVEYAVSEGFFGARSIEAAGLYVRRLDEEEQRAVARRLAAPTRGKDEQPFRP